LTLPTVRLLAANQVRQAAAAGRQRSVTCLALNTPGGPGSSKGTADIGFKFNPIYLGIIGERCCWQWERQQQFTASAALLATQQHC
jgi:hypothetical protein